MTTIQKLIAWTLLIVSVGFLFTACDGKTRYTEEGKQPTSSLTPAQVDELWRAIHKVNPSLTWGTNSGTGSMLPFFGSKAFTIKEPVTASTQIVPGDVVIFVREPNSTVRIIHQVQDVSSSGAVYISGINNKWPDGWIPRDQIKERLVALIYHQ